jgi:ubiquinone/menaquinone biosynthesis C-methylase UbiE
MPAAYDNYDYPSYWESRDYEHKSEIIALKSFLQKIPQVERLVDIGAGYGRLTPTYINRAKNIVLIDPSARLLKMARKSFARNKHVKFLHSKLENIQGKIKKESSDLIVMVRVIHHIEDLDLAFKTIDRILKKDGFLILEFANKSHFKASFKELLKGNITFHFDIFPKDIRSKKSVLKGAIPFINYHPEIITQKLKEKNFKIIEIRSVSNLRSSYLKNILPIDTILSLEKKLQTLLAPFNFGPSIFILAKKE